jgi:hypothetical protein
VQHTDQPVQTDVTPVKPADPKPRLVHKSHLAAGGDLLLEIRRYLLMRQVVLIGVALLLILHWIFPAPFDWTTMVLIAVLYALLVGSGGLEAARLSGTGGDLRRQERLAEDALRRAGRLQSHLEPGTATNEVLERILASGQDPRRAAILAGNEVEDALRAVYRHFAENERLAGTATGAELPIVFMVQELIWRGLLAPDIYDTAEPVLALRDMALTPRVQIEPGTASDAARAAQAIVLRVESLGIEIRPRRVPLAWMRTEPATTRPELADPGSRAEFVVPAVDSPIGDSREDVEETATLKFPHTIRGEQSSSETQDADVDQSDGASREPARDANHQGAAIQQNDNDPADPIVP